MHFTNTLPATHLPVPLILTAAAAAAVKDEEWQRSTLHHKLIQLSAVLCLCVAVCTGARTLPVASAGDFERHAPGFHRLGRSSGA